MKAIFRFASARIQRNLRTSISTTVLAISKAFWRHCLFTIFFLPALAFSQQWQFMNGPYGGKVHKFAVDPLQPDIIYAAVSAGNVVHKSVDGGLSWFESGPDSLGLSSSYLTIALDPQNTNNVFFGAGDGLFKSDDAGNSWTLTSLPHDRVASIAIDQLNPQIIYAGIYLSQYGECLWKSTDGGLTWELKSNGIPSPIGIQSCLTIAINPINPNSIYAGISSEGIFKTIDAGENWNYMGLGDNVIYDCKFIPWDTTIIFAATSSGIYRSINSGGNWSRVFDSAFSVGIDTLNRIIYTGKVNDGIYKSLDMGANWIPINNPHLPLSWSAAMRISDIAVNPHHPDTLLIGTDVGPYKSTNGGEIWIQSFDGIRGYSVYDIAFSASNSSMLFASGYQGVERSTNGGTTWKYIGGQGTLNQIAVDAFVPEIIYVSNVAQAGHHHILRTNNGGLTWGLTSASSIDLFQFIEADPETPDVVYASRYNSLLRSTDAGTNWNTIPAPFGNTSLDFHRENSDIMYLGSREGVYRTTDGGQNWDSLGLGNFDQDILVKSHPQKPDTIYATVYDQGFFRSTDGGQNWEEKNVNLTNISISQIVINSLDGDRVFLGTIGGGVFFSTNAGEEWTQLTPAPPSLSIKTLALNSSNPEKLLAAFRWLPGLYSFDFSTAINEGTQEYSEMDSYRLLPNYPNPFNAQTVIEYVLPVSGHITLKIYDITGRQVKVLVNGFKNAGAHTVTWNGTDDLGTVVSSGLYILRLLSEDMDISRKVLFIK